MSGGCDSQGARPPPPPASPPAAVGLSLCVLASGSAGNCAVLVSRPHAGAPRRVVLIDAGLSPRRTALLLLARGIRADEVDDIVLTHLDADHCHTGWAGAATVAARGGGWRARLRVHRRHMGRAGRLGLLFDRAEPFDDEVRIDDSLSAHAGFEAHDDLGVAVFRWQARGELGQAHLGYATDLGCVSRGLIDLMRGVDLLAIESNYCPVMQHASGRPAFLKQRIMGGSGHLSNRESAEAAAEIAPSEHLVLLHLSRQCNTPQAALRAHAAWNGGSDPGGGACVTDQFRPTGWFTVRGRVEHPGVAARPTAARSLFDMAPNGGAAW